ncbi:hypothetical protein ACFQXA_38765 [Nocardiopsis composta]
MLAIAGVLTLLSMVWTGWSVYDLLQQVAPKSPKTVAVAVAVAVELAWVAIVAVEWQHIHRSGAAPKGLVYTGWAIAATVVGVLALHAVKMESYYLLPLAALPLAGKALWSWALEDVAQAVRDRLEAARRAREKAAEEARAEEEKVAAEAAEEAARTERLSSGLTEAQEAELAEIRRRAAYITARSAAERSWTRRKRPPRPSGPRPSTPGAWTRCGAAPRSRCAPMRSTPRSCGAATSWPGSWSCRAPRCSPCRWAGRPTTPPGWRAPPAAPGHPMGFGGVFAQARGPQVRTGADLGVPPPPPPVPPGGAVLPEPHRRLLAYVEEHQERASVKGAGRALNVVPRTVRRYRDALDAAGYDMSPLYADR